MEPSGAEQIVALPNSQANSGQWHTVHVTRDGNEVTVAMDGGEGRNFNFNPLNEDGTVTLRPLAYISVGADIPPTQEDPTDDKIADDLIDSKQLHFSNGFIE